MEPLLGERRLNLAARRRPQGRRRSFLLAGLLAFFGAVSLGSWIYWRSSADPLQICVDLIVEKTGQRTVESRLSHGDHAPYPGKQPASPRKAFTDKRGRRAARQVLSEGLRSPSPSQLGRRAALHLHLGEVDRAVGELEEAVSRAPGDAALQSALGAAYLERARKGEALDLLLGLSRIERALVLAPALPEARFNRALCLEDLFLTAEARAAWAEYLEVDSTSEWAEEARSHAGRLAPTAAPDFAQLEDAADAGRVTEVRAFFRRYPQHARLYAENVPLSRWAAAWEAGQVTDAARWLRIARALGTWLKREAGDRLVLDAVAAIAAAQVGDPRRLAALAEGHQAFAEGQAHAGSDDPGAAKESFVLARGALSRGGSPFLGLADLYLGIQEYYRPAERALALERLGELQGRTAGKHYPYLRSRAFAMIGLLQFIASQPGPAFHAYRQALGEAERSREPAYVAYVHCLLGHLHGRLGDDRTAWNHWLQALRGRAGLADPRRVYSVLTGSAEAALESGMPEVALAFQNELVGVASASGLPGVQGESLLRRSQIQALLGSPALAAIDLQAAAKHIDEVADKDLAERIEADLSSIQAAVRAANDPAAAAALYSRALEYLERNGPLEELLGVYRGRARAFTALRQWDRAEEDLRAAVVAIEDKRRWIVRPELLGSYLDRVRGVFDDLVQLRLRSPGGAVGAFDFAERGRGRLLLDSSAGLLRDDGVLGERLQPLSLGELRRRLPENVALVEYAVLPDRLLIWLIRPRSEGAEAAVFVRPVRADDLALAVHRFREEIEQGGSGLGPESVGALLHGLLLRDVLTDLAPETSLVFVPDKFLQSLPFAALPGRGADRYLIQDFAVAVAPSATFYVAAAERSPRRGGQGVPGALVIGDAVIDRSLFPALDDLEAAAAEARDVAALYEVEPVLGEGASEERFLELLPAAEVVHFVGHAVENVRFPLDSGLLLTRQRAGDDGLLKVAEIAPLRLPATRLVVLAACSTASGRNPSNDGLVNLARPFLAAGVPTVVGSLWRVGDEPTAELFRYFHRQVLAGAPAGEALRAAQFALLASADQRLRRPAAWAGFQVMGHQGGIR